LAPDTTFWRNIYFGTGHNILAQHLFRHRTHKRPQTVCFWDSWDTCGKISNIKFAQYLLVHTVYTILSETSAGVGDWRCAWVRTLVPSVTCLFHSENI
jgi:hypothetical protein